MIHGVIPMVGVRIKYRDGSIEFRLSDDILVVKALNNEIELRPRSILVEEIEKYEVGGNNKNKYIYVYFPEELAPLPYQPYAGKKQVETITVGRYEVRYTDSQLGEYYTIITPGTHLYDYVIIIDKMLSARASGKREVYIDMEDKPVAIYFV